MKHDGSEFELNDQLRVAEDSFPEGNVISTGLTPILIRPTQ